MATIVQIIKKPRIKKYRKVRTTGLNQCPQKKGRCYKITIINPKKPNSAKRKVSKVYLKKDHKKLISYIVGENHTLQENSYVLIKGGRVPDLIGIKYKNIRGKYDFKFDPNRKKSRSKYGTPKNKK